MAQQDGPSRAGDAQQHNLLSDEDIVTEPYAPRRAFLRQIGLSLSGALSVVLGSASPKAGAADSDPSDAADPPSGTSPRSDWKDNDSESRLADPKLGDYTSGNHQEDGYDYDNDMRRWGGDRKDSDE